jgi:hypothetical protein
MRAAPTMGNEILEMNYSFYFGLGPVDSQLWTTEIALQQNKKALIMAKCSIIISPCHISLS